MVVATRLVIGERRTTTRPPPDRSAMPLVDDLPEIMQQVLADRSVQQTAPVDGCCSPQRRAEVSDQRLAVLMLSLLKGRSAVLPGAVRHGEATLLSNQPWGFLCSLDAELGAGWTAIQAKAHSSDVLH